VRYLAATYGAGSLWPNDPGARGVADQWMDWQQTTLLPDMRTIFWGLVRTAPELAKTPFVAGDRLTMGDIPIGVMCYRYHALGVERAPLAHLEAWYERLTSRDAFRTHVMIPLE
jgi:glutathione S-transferase